MIEVSVDPCAFILGIGSGEGTTLPHTHDPASDGSDKFCIQCGS